MKIVEAIASSNPLVGEILSLITMAIRAARSEEAKKVVESARKAIKALFTANLITIQEQNDVMLFMDEIEGMVDRGEVPPHWQQDQS